MLVRVTTLQQQATTLYQGKNTKVLQHNPK